MPAESHRVLLVDDQPANRESWRAIFAAEGYSVVTAADTVQALAHLRRATVNLVVSDVRMDEDHEGIALLQAVKREWPSMPVLLYTGWAKPDDRALAIQLGAEDYFSLPIPPLVVVNAMRTALDGLRTAVGHSSQPGAVESVPIVAASQAMKALLRWVHRTAATDVSVLITGETGTGKELIARALHAGSQRAKAPFVAVNCGAIPAGVEEAEFFGHRKGAFTSAHSDQPGLVEAAHGGTLFLDEIGELPLGMQTILLRFLDSGELRRLGENAPRHANVRIIAATNRPLAADAIVGRFRRDLYYRLRVATYDIPPLRHRPEDLEEFVAQWCVSMERQTPIRLTPAARTRLLAHDWPGNVRELRNVLQRAVTSYGDFIDLPEINSALDDVPGDGREAAASEIGETDKNEGDERARLLHALEKHHWNKTETAASLGMSRWTLRRRLRELSVLP